MGILMAAMSYYNLSKYQKNVIATRKKTILIVEGGNTSMFYCCLCTLLKTLLSNPAFSLNCVCKLSAKRNLIS